MILKLLAMGLASIGALVLFITALGALGLTEVRLYAGTPAGLQHFCEARK